MQAIQHSVTTPDGRVLAVHEIGEPDGRVVFAMHGTPGCGTMRPAVGESAAELGLRLLAHDRPGYGGSTRQPGRTIASVAADGHGRWLAEHVPGAVFHYEPDLGHVSLIEQYVPAAQAWLGSWFAP